MSEPTSRPADGTPTLELRGVNKSFGAIQVLHDVNMAVYQGKVTALVGDNGAGKSTLIKGGTPKTTGTANDPEGTRQVPSVLLDPISITKANVKQVIDDGYQKASDVCTGQYATFCQQAGIS